MPVWGLSLLGVMEQQFALQYLSQGCIVPDSSGPALLQHWNDAKARLGPPMPNAGHPQIQDIPVAHAPYLQQIAAHARFNPQFGGAPPTFKLVEIAPLLAYQFAVIPERPATHCTGLPNPPQLTDLLPLCLPTDVEPFQSHATPVDHGVLLKHESLNFRILGRGPLGNIPINALAVGAAVGISDPWMRVVRFNGRCYLNNGYHRACGLRAAGATHMPCIVIDATDVSGVGLIPGATFDQVLLESGDPPTCGHLTPARAYGIFMKRFTRAVHVTWAEYPVCED